MISNLTLVTCLITLFVTLLLPIILISVFSFRNKKQKLISAWALGAAGFFVTQMVIRLPILTVLQSQPWFVSFSVTNGFLYAFSLAFTAGLFELAGRFVVAKLMQKNLSCNRALAAGLGHGGIEAMILVGITYLNNILYIFMINNGTFQNCESLHAVKIPDGVTAIGDCAFEGCGALEKADLPDSLTNIGVGVPFPREVSE